MQRQIILILLLELSLSAWGQKKNSEEKPPQPLTKKEWIVEEKNHHCIKKTPKSFSVRLKNYPFNLATQIQFVSFKKIDDSIKFRQRITYDSLPRQNDTICYSTLTEVKSLTFLQVDRLTDILYNYTYSGIIRIMEGMGCYYPKNAILFLDKAGKVFEYIEICFECDWSETSSEKILLRDMCDEKMVMLKNLFKEVGIELGVTKGLKFVFD